MSKEPVKIEITDLAFDGKSVGHTEDGKVVFLKGGLPGELVEAEITRTKPRYNEARVLRIITKSDRRVTAPCPHFEECGGCTWQDLTYADQLLFKKKQVVECIQRIGSLSDVIIEDVIGSVEVFHYRNKMEFSFNTTDNGTFTVGLHKRGSFEDIFDLDTCLLPDKIYSDILAWVRNYVATESIPVYDVKRHYGYIRFLVIRQAKRTNDLMVNIVTNFGEFPSVDRFVRGLTTSFPQITTIVHNQNGQRSNIAVGEKEQVLYGPGFIEERLFDCRFRVRANSFFQTNSLQCETLYRTAFEMLEAQKHYRVLDLYCGTGTIGILMAPLVQNVVAVELVMDAINAARDNAHINNIQNVTFYQGDVKDFLKSSAGKEHFDAIVIDPPRAGLNPKAIKHLLNFKAPKIMYISCNPATFARDAKELVAGGYVLPAVKPVDMFPHTMHIELAAVFQLE